MGVTVDTAARAFQDLQAKGFIHITEAARLGVGGEAKGSSYEITEITMPHGDSSAGRRLYLKWTNGQDFPVVKVAANNPEGRNKTKACHGNLDSNVTNFKTAKKNSS